MKGRDFHPDIKSEDLKLLSELNVDAHIKKRLLAVAALKEGKTYKEAAIIAGINISTVWTLKKRFKEKGLKALLIVRDSRLKFSLREKNLRPACKKEKLKKVKTTKLINFEKKEKALLKLRKLVSQTQDELLRKRYLLIIALLEGRTYQEAGVLSGLKRPTFYKWITRFNKKGVAGLKSQDNYFKRKKIRKNLERATQLKEILIKETNPSVRKGLKAITAILEGKSFKEAAFTSELISSGVRSWFKRYKKAGIGAFLDYKKKNRTSLWKDKNITANELYEMASQEQNYGIRRRLLGMAVLAEGKTLKEAAETSHMSVSMIHYLLKRFNEKGIASLLVTIKRKPSSL